MKIRQIIYVHLLILSLGFAIAIPGCTNKPEPKVTKPVKRNTAPVSEADIPELAVDYTLTGEVEAPIPKQVHFNIPGMLESGEISLRTRATFRKNQLLFQLNNAAAFRALNTQKQQLAQLVQSQLPAIRGNFPAETEKWELYLRALGPENLVPAFPTIASREEQDFLLLQNIPAQHAALQQLQDDMRLYFYLAPFDGNFAEISISPGQSISKGQNIALISPKNKFLLNAHVGAESLNAWKKNPRIDFRNAQGMIVASGKLDKVSQDPKDAQLHVLRYLITPKNGAKIKPGDILQTSATGN